MDVQGLIKVGAHAAVAAWMALAGIVADAKEAGVMASTSFVPQVMAQRVMRFTEGRVWQREDGVVLVCPLKVALEACKKSQGSRSPWVDVQSLSIDGYEISGFQYSFTGSNVELNLLVFFSGGNELSTLSKQQAKK